MYVAAPVALETFLSRYASALLEPTPEPVAESVAVAAPTVIPAAPAPVQTPDPVAALDDEWTIEPEAAEPISAGRVEPQAAKPVGAAPGPVDLTDLLEPSSIPAIKAAAAAVPPAPPLAKTPKPLFDPDAPFTVPSPSPAVAAAQPPAARQGGGRSKSRLVAAIAAVVVIATIGMVAFRQYGSSASPSLGTLVVQSNPGGVQVFVDGMAHGVTPAKFSVAAGSHILELRGRGVPRVIPINVGAGAEVSQYLEFADSPRTGHLAVQTEPAGAKVVVDGVERGVAPMTISDLAPGDHEVVLRSADATARHMVNVQAGGTASLVVPLAAASTGPVSGWLSVKAPFTIEIREEGRLLGTTDTDKVMMAAGKHDIELVNEPLGYRSKRSLQVPPGKVAAISVDLPNGVVNLNASPWAEVFVDGRRVGETPIGNLSIPIGPHEFVFKHPQFGEKRQAASVTLGAPVRLSVDMK
jgi:hypothetical protein